MTLTIKNILLLFLAFTLVILPLSASFAAQNNSSSMAMSKAPCEKKASKHSTSKHHHKEDSSSKHMNIDDDKCTCKTDCNHSNCTSNCSDCSHSVLGILNIDNSSPTIHPLKISTISKMLYQDSFMVQFRPPRTLHS